MSWCNNLRLAHTLLLGGLTSRITPKPTHHLFRQSLRLRLTMAESQDQYFHSNQGNGEPKKADLAAAPIRRLYAFDFDHTIIEENSDYEVKKLLKGPVPPEIESRCTATTFTEYMDLVMKYIGSQGTTIEEVGEFMTTLKLVPGMEGLFKKIDTARANANGSESQFIVVSDANDFFIRTILSNAVPEVEPDAIITNVAVQTKVIDENTKQSFDYLRVVPFDKQTECDWCPPNLCKGKVLRRYLREHGPFQSVYYVGDGHNDFCPARELTPDDTLFVRHGFSLEKILKKPIVGRHSTALKCSVVFWNDANDIVPFIQFK